MQDIKVLVAERDPDSFLTAIERQKPDVLVIDVSHPNGEGIECARKARRIHAPAQLVALADDTDDEALVDVYDIGAAALVSKAQPIRELHRAIVDAAAHRAMLDRRLVERARERMRRGNGQYRPDLDATDRKMLELLTRGCTDRQIAEEVYLSLQSVRNRMSRLLNKFGMSNRTQLALHIAASNGKNGAVAAKNLRSTTTSGNARKELI